MKKNPNSINPFNGYGLPVPAADPLGYLIDLGKRKD